MNVEIRAPIARSWERTALSGLLPTSDVRAVIDDADIDGALARAALPVIDDLAEQLQDTACALILADRTQRIVVRRFGHRGVGAALDDVAAVPGSTYTEQTSGTNAISTVFETGEAVFVLGEEHYLDKLQQFRCYGRPIVHPITGVLEGVLDITGLQEGSEGLMRALIVTAARAIEGQLLLASPTSQVRLLGAYQNKVARSHHAVVAFGRNLTLSNDAARPLVDDVVLEELRALCRSRGDVAHTTSVSLRAGAPASVAAARIVPVDGSIGSFVVELVTDERPRPVPRSRTAAVASSEGSRETPRLARAILERLVESGTPLPRRLSALETVEYHAILDALERHGGNKSHAAAELGMGRSTFYRRLREFGLDR